MTESKEGTEKPGWIKDPDTGELLPVEKDARYHDALQKFYESECIHPASFPMRVRVAGGSVQVRECCIICGERTGNALAQRDRAWVESLPWLADDLGETYRSRRHTEKQAILLGLAREQYAENGRFTANYRTYIQSPEWKARRKKVMARCDGICEGCGDRAAAHVHHLTYEHFGNEFLFELVGLCGECHERLHAHDAETAIEEAA